MSYVMPLASGATAMQKPDNKLEVRDTGELQSAHAHILLYGKTKAGKTTTAVSLEPDPSRVRIISTQPEEQLAHLKKLGIKYVCVKNAEQLRAAVRDPRALFPGEWSTLIMDDMTEGTRFLSENIEDIGDFKGEGKKQVYKILGQEVREMLRDLMARDFNLVWTFFERELMDATSPIAWIGPDLPPSASGIVMAKFSWIFYVQPNYKLLTRKDESRRIIAGNRMPLDKLNALPVECEPNLRKIWDTYKSAISA